MAGSVTVAVCKRPSHSQSTFLVLAKVFHTKDSGAVLVCIKVAEGHRVAQTAIIYVRAFRRRPLRVGKDVDIRFFAVGN